MIKEYDFVIFGAGIYGMFAAKILAGKGLRVALIEFDNAPFQRASYINQARVHNGYHYPRSVSTAGKSAKYFKRFNEEFSFAINNQFKKIYAISSDFSLSNAEQFLKFCNYVHIPAIEINSKIYFNEGTVEAAFEVNEYSFDAIKIKDWFIEEFKRYSNLEIFCDTKLTNVENTGESYRLIFNDKNLIIKTPRVLNATFSSINQIIEKFGFEKFKIKYELSETILAEADHSLKNVGITVMDGPFFSSMPFGLSGLHTLTAVDYTPHRTSYDDLPSFECQNHSEKCNPLSLENCNLCPVKPKTAWVYMYQLSKKYLNSSIDLRYKQSLFAIKAILMASELDDSRPTVIRVFSKEPLFISVLSGKINTIFDLEDVL